METNTSFQDIDLPHGALSKLFCRSAMLICPCIQTAIAGGALWRSFLPVMQISWTASESATGSIAVNARIVSSGELLSETMLEYL
jgi:hypothetical protein